MAMAVTVKKKGLVIDKENPVLAASIDGQVTDPTNKYHSVVNIEKNTNYSHQS